MSENQITSTHRHAPGTPKMRGVVKTMTKEEITDPSTWQHIGTLIKTEQDPDTKIIDVYLDTDIRITFEPFTIFYSDGTYRIDTTDFRQTN